MIQYGIAAKMMLMGMMPNDVYHGDRRIEVNNALSRIVKIIIINAIAPRP